MELKNKITQFNLPESMVTYYGNDMAKINWEYVQAVEPEGKLILVTAITPTPLGEGKTTVSIGLTDAINSINQDNCAVAALREPSLGPVFGRKGGATGGGETELVPVDKINLHFTGDFHAITSAHNLITAMLEQQLYFDLLPIDPQTITWKRVIDMNDRSLRNIDITVKKGVSYSSGFQITASSEIMAILCLAEDIDDLRYMLEHIVLAQDYEGQNITVKQLQITDALIALLKDAYSPNLVQTKAGSLAIIHGGPFANIAHGCNSILATKLGLSIADYTVTEAGFGSDLGAEKFLDIKAPKLGKVPDCIVLVATIRSLKYHGGMELADVTTENPQALHRGLANLQAHINNLLRWNLPVVVTLNVFEFDAQTELEYVKKFVEQQNIACVLNTAYHDGASGAVELAQRVITTIQDNQLTFEPLYRWSDTTKDKIDKIANFIYGAQDVIYSEIANEVLSQEGTALDGLPICIAKTPESFTMKASNRGIPQPFIAHVRDIKVAHGAGMIIVYMGNIIDMPGLPKAPNAQKITVNEQYQIDGVD